MDANFESDDETVNGRDYDLERHKAHVLAEVDAIFGFKQKRSEAAVNDVEETTKGNADKVYYREQQSSKYNEYAHNREKEVQDTGFSEPYMIPKDTRYMMSPKEAAEYSERSADNHGERNEQTERDQTESHSGESCQLYTPAEASERVNDVPMETENVHYRQLMKFDFESPVETLDYKKCFQETEDNYTKGCKWSPDGSCLLVGSVDKKLRLFNLPNPVAMGQCLDESWQAESERYNLPAVTVRERELIYDYAWYPHMRSDNPQSCCFAVTCRDQPVHLWDAWNGNLVCSYQSYDHLDQLVAAKSVGFSLDGSMLLCGFKKTIRIFHTSRPGRTFETIDAKGQPGIISCMAFNPRLPNIFVAGSYLGNLGFYNTRRNNLFCRLDGCTGGVTQVAFSSCGIKLFTGTRKDDEILCWDIRKLGTILYSLKREISTNQRIYFDLEPELCRYLVSGDTRGKVLKWDLDQQGVTECGDSVPVLQPSASFPAHKDCCNGISLHPYNAILATSSGQRHFPEPVESDSSSDESVSKPMFSKKKITQENTVKLWWLGGRS